VGDVEHSDITNTRRRKRIARAALIATLGLVTYFVANLMQVWWTGQDDSFATGDTRVDAIVVLGAAQYDGRPSPQLQARLDHALALWQRDTDALLVVTGGKQEGDRFTEAESSRRFFVDNGVPATMIVVEPRGRSTVESLRAVADDLTQAGVNRVVVVSDPYHVLRAKLVANEMGLRAHASATREGVVRGTAALRRNVREALGVMVGRVSGFRRLDGWLH
jgi:uncharacterized SAM-binding protein YcdF (DUF218 family)